MATQEQSRNPNPRLNVGPRNAVVVLAVLLVLTLATGMARAQTLNVIYTFEGGFDGAQPFAGLTIDHVGNLYGTTHSGNEGVNWGNVYRLRPHSGGWTFDKLQLFDGALANRPVFGPDHTLYGTSPNQLTTYANGYIYNLRPPVNVVCNSIFGCPWNASIAYGFLGGADGGQPRYGDLIFDQAGNMYGTASIGGAGYGVVFKMTRSGNNWNETPIWSFTNTPDGATPFAGVIFDTAGNLYGTTMAGGTSGNGAVYELSPSGGGWSERVIYNFTGGSDGNNPNGGLAIDNAGNLFGTTSNGGSGGGGTVFELSPNGGGFTYSLIHSFTGGTNCGPWATVTLDNAGNLYGTTVCDGANSDGNIFKLTSSGGGYTYSSLHDFNNSDGRRPISNVVFDSAGNMYGTTSLGGSAQSGVIWKLAPQ